MKDKLKKLFSFLNENKLTKEALFVHKLTSYDEPIVIAYKEDLWLLNSDIDYNPSSSDRKILSNIAKKVGLEPPYEDVIQNIKENRPDVLVARIDGDMLSLESGDPAIHPSFSLTVRKAVRQLGLSGAKVYGEDLETGDWREDVIYESEMPKQFPPQSGNIILYHGTSTKHLSSIFSEGLIPNPGETNFDRIRHDQDVFFTSNFMKAQFHAMRALHNNHYQPIILEVLISEPYKLGPDYDVDVMVDSDEPSFSAQEYTFNTNTVPEPAEGRGSMPLSRETGIFSYRGKVLPQHIKAIHYFYPEHGWSRTTDPSDFVKLIRYYEDLGGEERVLPGQTYEQVMYESMEMAREDLEYELRKADYDLYDLDDDKDEKLIEIYVRTGTYPLYKEEIDEFIEDNS